MNKIESLEALDHALSHLGVGKDSAAQDRDAEITALLAEMKAAILEKGDAAVLGYTQKFDKLQDPNFTMRLSQDEIAEAYEQVSEDYIEALKRAKSNIEDYHRLQYPEDKDEKKEGYSYGLKYTALTRVGLYVPGGLAVYPSTVLMNSIPAKIAGVENLVMISPPNKEGKLSPQVVVAADISGIEEIYKVGGAQGVLALAYGTESIPSVDKIVGPGNIYVTKAKQAVYGTVDIDKPAGPSEVLVYLEESRYAAAAASELLAQLEHDPLASAICIAPSEALLEAVHQALEQQFSSLTRQEILAKSKANLFYLETPNQEAVNQAINHIASEHLVLLVDDYEALLAQVKHAGSIFCGPYTPVTLGDYYAGPNHVLPTERAARYASPLGVLDFMKYSSYLHYSKEKLASVQEDLKILTEMEGLDAHYQAVKRRIDDE